MFFPSWPGLYLIGTADDQRGARKIRMKRWYVVQVYPGYEEAVRLDILRRIRAEGAEQLFGEILVPSAKVKHLFETVENQKDQQLFPGYLLVEMEMVPEAIQLVLAVPRAYKFLGGAEPMPVSKREIERIREQVSGSITVGAEKIGISVGTEVDIIEGPFAGFMGVVDKVDAENEKLTVMVSIFGRMTPVELGFHQIKQ